MNNLPTDIIEEQDWYKSLVDDCQSVITEGVFNSRQDLLQAYHQLGERILEDEKKFEETGIYGEGITKRVSLSLNLSQRTIQYAIKFAKKFPDIQQLPEGKNISWHKMVSKYLPDKPEQKEKPIYVRIRVLPGKKELLINGKYKGYKITFRD